MASRVVSFLPAFMHGVALIPSRTPTAFCAPSRGNTGLSPSSSFSAYEHQVCLYSLICCQDRHTFDYTTQFDVRFRSQESFERISPDSDVLHVPLPQKPETHPGGLGLEDVEWLLHPYNGAESDAIMDQKTLDEEGRPHRLLDCKIKRREGRSMPVYNCIF